MIGWNMINLKKYINNKIVIHGLLIGYSIILMILTICLNNYEFIFGIFALLIWLNIAPILIYLHNKFAVTYFWNYIKKCSLIDKLSIIDKEITYTKNLLIFKIGYTLILLLYVFIYFKHSPFNINGNYLNIIYFLLLMLLTFIGGCLSFTAFLEIILLFQTTFLLLEYYRKRKSYLQDYSQISQLVKRYSSITFLCISSAVLFTPIIIKLFKTITKNDVYLYILLLIYVFSLLLTAIAPNWMCFNKFIKIKEYHIQLLNQQLYNSPYDIHLKKQLEILKNAHPSFHDREIYKEIILAIIVSSIPAIITRMLI